MLELIFNLVVFRGASEGQTAVRSFCLSEPVYYVGLSCVVYFYLDTFWSFSAARVTLYSPVLSMGRRSKKSFVATVGIVRNATLTKYII